CLIGGADLNGGGASIYKRIGGTESAVVSFQSFPADNTVAWATKLVVIDNGTSLSVTLKVYKQSDLVTPVKTLGPATVTDAALLGAGLRMGAGFQDNSFKCHRLRTWDVTDGVEPGLSSLPAAPQIFAVQP